MTTTLERLTMVWQWCRTAYLQRGRRLEFPKDTDRTKTYQWRYLEALERKLTGWNLDDTLSKRFIEIAVAYAAEHKLMAKGMAVFFQANLMDVCYERLQRNLTNTNQTIETITAIQAWIDNKTNDRPLLQTLLQRSHFGAYSNIVRWYQGHNITDLYLTLSKSCMVALARLARDNQQERKLLPTATNLFLLRSTFIKDPYVKSSLHDILRDDWRPLCL